MKKLFHESPDLEKFDELCETGFALLQGVFSPAEIAGFLGAAIEKLAGYSDGIKSLSGETYAARNILKLIPESIGFWQKPRLLSFLANILGNEFGLVRGLYFDKHPNRTWSLGWHKDMTIAVRDNKIPTSQFSKPTKKSGIPHVEASEQLLSRMLTLRIHLDDVTDDNGPLEVIPQSHLHGKSNTEFSQPSKRIKCKMGDVLVMRPLLSHASGSSTPGIKMHRRILHLEFAPDQALPDDYQWYDFIRPGPETKNGQIGQIST